MGMGMEMEMPGGSARPRIWLRLLPCFLLLVPFLSRSAEAQGRTDPIEADALNTMFDRWGISADTNWNLSGDPCTGWAIDYTIFHVIAFNPAIKCDCTFNNNTLCHIIKLKVFGLDVTGPIPDEIKKLPFLENLQLSENFLTGSLPAFIGNLSLLEYFTVGSNSLSGPLPKEFGNLRKLLSAGLDDNKFNGTIPPEFGNLINLEQLYINNLELNGEFPSTFSKLKKLKTLYASDAGLTGRLPDFLGNLTSLTSLRIQGNSLQGPIPASFAKLTKMTDLRIGEIENVSSTLDFMHDMKLLNILVIRNSKVTGTLPSNIGEFANLNFLDLSFNNLTGSLPQSLFNLSSLGSLYLGNNSFSGRLPAQKGEKLLNIDLSYNQLSGEFPSWTSDDTIQLNLVANNFIIDSSNKSILKSGLQCLQRSISCNRNSPIYSEFFINCGGDKTVTGSDGKVYDFDNANATTASYFVTPESRWAVSSVGSFMDVSNPTYLWSSTAAVTNTSDPALFQSSRHSPSSLRYYGLGLENGNYTIKLGFAELGFESRASWKSLGRRLFNIYIQGILVAENFDIMKEAGGAVLTAIWKEFSAQVADNFLEIHFFWAGKGSCCIPFDGYYGPSVSAISVSPKDFIPTVSNTPPRMAGSKGTNKGLIAGITTAVAAICLLLVFGFIRYRKMNHMATEEDKELLGLLTKADIFSYAELKVATEDFDTSNKLGEGGFGLVFKGKLPDGRMIAVKQLIIPSLQGKKQFVTEIETISAVQHRNVVRLYGCCFEGDKRLLVYEYLENKSLDKALFGSSRLLLDWQTRFEICLGTARGLSYLHEESRLRIIHRDVKASNILLDENLTPKISDFGLAKLYDDKKTHISTRVAGTIGYLAPEYAMRGHLTEKVDVFGFGVVALEIVCGRKNTESEMEEGRMYLLEWAWHLHERNADIEMVDPTLQSYDREEALRVIGAALLCTQASPALRPSMSRVVAILVGDAEVGQVSTKPGYLTSWQFGDTSSEMSSRFVMYSDQMDANSETTA